MRSALIADFALSIGPGNVTTTFDLDPLNLTWAKTILGELTLTTIATDAADSLSVKFQETRVPERSYYDTRAYWRLVPGNTAASAATPYADQWDLAQDVDLTAPERNPVPTGSSTGVELTPGTVRDGPFAPIIRTALGKLSTQRIVAAISGDGNANASYIGRIRLWAHEWSV